MHTWLRFALTDATRIFLPVLSLMEFISAILVSFGFCTKDLQHINSCLTGHGNILARNIECLSLEVYIPYCSQDLVSM